MKDIENVYITAFNKSGKQTLLKLAKNGIDPINNPFPRIIGLKIRDWCGNVLTARQRRDIDWYEVLTSESGQKNCVAIIAGEYDSEVMWGV